MGLANALTWLQLRFTRPGPGTPAPEPPPDARAKTYSPHSSAASIPLRLFLGGGGPGWWASDHLEESRHFTNWNYCAANAVAKQAAAASVSVYRKTARPKPAGPPGAPKTKGMSAPDASDDGRDPLPESHPLVKLLDRPNPYQSGMVWRYTLAQQLRVTGNALVWLVLNQLGTPAELWAIPTALAQPQPPTEAHPLGAYWVSALGTTGYAAESGWAAGAPWAQGTLVDARFTRRVRWPHPLFLGDGLSPMAATALWSDVADDIDRATASTFRREIRPGLQVKTDAEAGVHATDEQLQRLKADLNAQYAGAENAGKIVVYPPGVEPVDPNRSPSELDYIGGRPVARDAVLASHATPATAVGVSEATAYAAYVAAMTQWLDLSVQPDLDLLAGELTHFLAPHYGGDVCLEFSAKRPDDPQVTKLKTDALADCLTVNEKRALWGMPPVPWGDERPQQPVGPGGENRGQGGRFVAGAQGGPPPDAIDTPEAPSAKRTGQKRPDLKDMPRSLSRNGLHSGVNGMAGGGA